MIEFGDDLDEELDEDLEDWDEEQEDLEGVSYVCEDCDYRWEESSLDEASDGSMVCPMCGSINVTQL
jgi:transcription initiation factor IIE alpha subunit